jgi:putative SOS response-associated peptidase YedK
MPVILSPEAFTEWLESQPLAADRLQEVLTPHHADDMEAYPVSTHVNKPANDDPECVVRVG